LCELERRRLLALALALALMLFSPSLGFVPSSAFPRQPR